jgi:hypothetical protein
MCFKFLPKSFVFRRITVEHRRGSVHICWDRWHGSVYPTAGPWPPMSGRACRSGYTDFICVHLRHLRISLRVWIATCIKANLEACNANPNDLSTAMATCS